MVLLLVHLVVSLRAVQQLVQTIVQALMVVELGQILAMLRRGFHITAEVEVAVEMVGALVLMVALPVLVAVAVAALLLLAELFRKVEHQLMAAMVE
jgi:hypothetical protein